MFRFLAFRDRLENRELFFHFLRHFHDGSNIVAPVAVIGGWPDSHQISRLKPKLEPFLDELVGSGNELQTVDIVKVPNNFIPKYVACSSVVCSPAFNILRIWPHQIAKWAWIVHNVPVWGISILRSIVLIWSIVLISGERPPWMQSTAPLMSAPSGR